MILFLEENSGACAQEILEPRSSTIPGAGSAPLPGLVSATRQAPGESPSRGGGTSPRPEHGASLRNDGGPSTSSDGGPTADTGQEPTGPSSTEIDPHAAATNLPHRTNRIRKPKAYTDSTIRYGYGCLAVGNEPHEPHDLSKALGNKNWKHAMDEEFSALQDNKTWHLVPAQEGKNLIDCKWVYKIKRKADGSIDRYKARLVAKGFKQRYGIDY